MAGRKGMRESLMELRSFAKDLTLQEDKTEWDWERINCDIFYANQWYEKQLEIWRGIPIERKADLIRWSFKMIQLAGIGAFQDDGLLFGESISTKENSLGRRILRLFGLAQSLRKEE